jgi:hypothetical protein
MDPRKRWDSQLEGGLPDSRLSASRRHDNMVTIGRLSYERVFCANCGKPGGAVTPEFAAHVFYVCDNCACKCGDPPGLAKIC